MLRVLYKVDMLSVLYTVDMLSVLYKSVNFPAPAPGRSKLERPGAANWRDEIDRD